MKFGITPTFSCSYLDNREEQLLVFVEEIDDDTLASRLTADHHYARLIQAGFRRSGEQIYRPHCPSCQACQSLRIPVTEFSPSKSQKRIANKNRHLNTQLSTELKPDYYPLYERYINERHQNGSMYPPDETQFLNFVDCNWKTPLYIEGYDGEKLISVAVTDQIDALPQMSHSALSALYTFFDPDYAQTSIGTWMILEQIEHAKRLGHPYVYLGYQIDESPKMNYKGKFFPHERFIDNKWQRISKK